MDDAARSPCRRDQQNAGRAPQPAVDHRHHRGNPQHRGDEAVAQEDHRQFRQGRTASTAVVIATSCSGAIQPGALSARWPPRAGSPAPSRRAQRAWRQSLRGDVDGHVHDDRRQHRQRQPLHQPGRRCRACRRGRRTSPSAACSRCARPCACRPALADVRRGLGDATAHASAACRLGQQDFARVRWSSPAARRFRTLMPPTTINRPKGNNSSRYGTACGRPRPSVGHGSTTCGGVLGQFEARRAQSGQAQP